MSGTTQTSCEECGAHLSITLDMRNLNTSVVCSKCGFTSIYTFEYCEEIADHLIILNSCYYVDKDRVPTRNLKKYYSPKR